MELLNAYAEYVVAYNLYIDKYLPNKDESVCEFEIAICDILFDKFESLLSSKYDDDDIKDCVTDILCTTDHVSKKIDMAKNITEYFKLFSSFR